MPIDRQKDGELRFEMLKLRFGHLFTPEQLDEIKESAQQVADIAEQLRNVKLGNDDGPGDIFQPYRGAD